MYDKPFYSLTDNARGNCIIIIRFIFLIKTKHLEFVVPEFSFSTLALRSTVTARIRLTSRL